MPDNRSVVINEKLLRCFEFKCKSPNSRKLKQSLLLHLKFLKRRTST